MSLKGCHLHIDCASGAAGDMMLGALIDLGVPIEVIGDALDRIGAGRGRLILTRVLKHGIAAVDIKVDTKGELEGAGVHSHGHATPHLHIFVDAEGHAHEHLDVSARLSESEPESESESGRAPHSYSHSHSHSHSHPHSHGASSHSHDDNSHSHRGGSDAKGGTHSHGDSSHSHGGSHSHGDGSHAKSGTHSHGDSSHSHGGPHSHGDGSHAKGGGSDAKGGTHSHGDSSHSHGGSHSHGDGSHSHDHGSHSHDHGSHSHDERSDEHGTHERGDGAHEHRHGDGQHEHEHGHEHEHEHEHDHSRGEHAHYHYGSIRKRISSSDLADTIKQRALDIFDRLARAEAKLHGTTIDEVALHEVGAIDSVVDIVGTAAALDWLSPSSVTCTSVAMGHGTLTCAHGVLPVPAPAALEVLRDAGGIMADGGVARELCTPTGAAILASTVTRWGPAPVGKPLGIGWGAGDWDLPDRSNTLRAIALAPSATSDDAIWQIDANIDDMSPELCAPALDAVLAAGAVDAWWTTIAMKKGRQALQLSALVILARRDEVIAAILRETTTIGVRYSPRERTVVDRAIVEVDTRYGRIPVKVAGDNAAPEYEACAAAARDHGVAVKLVFAAAIAAYDFRRR